MFHHQSEDQLVQKIGLAFTISTLYLLVQPRPEEVEEFELKASTYMVSTPCDVFCLTYTMRFTVLITHMKVFSASGSLWEMQDSNPGPLPQQFLFKLTEFKMLEYTDIMLQTSRTCSCLVERHQHAAVRNLPVLVQWNAIKRRNPVANMPLFLRNASLAFILYSGWKERKALPSNATLAYEKRKDTSNRYLFEILIKKALDSG